MCDTQETLLTAIPTGLSDFQAAGAVPSSLHDCGGGNWEIVYGNLTAETAETEIERYISGLCRAGYTCYSDNRIRDNRFFTYCKDETLIHCNYFPALGEFRVIFGPKGYLPDTAPVTDYKRRVTPSISVIGMTDNVMCLVFQAADGSFVVIDGGWGTSAVYDKVMNKDRENEQTVHIQRDADYDMNALMSFLRDNAPDGEKPQVTWMITHGDPDHTTLPEAFFGRYRNEFDLNTICYNFPNLFNVGLGSHSDPAHFTGFCVRLVESARTHFPEAKHYIYHTGEKLQLPGAEIEFLFCHEDFWPHRMPWMNHTCGAWRIYSEGKTILIPGDTDVPLNQQMAKVYGTYLKSDIFQPCHHGANGGELGFYQLVDPTICFWMCQQYHLDRDRRHTGLSTHYDFNKFLRESPNVIAHYSNSKTVTILLPELKQKQEETK